MNTITLRRATAADAERLHEIRSEASASVHQPLKPYGLNELREVLERRVSDRLDPDFAGKAQFAVKFEGATVGWVSLDVTSREHGVASVGYTIAEAARGRGIATAAVRQIIALAFDPTGPNLDRLEAVASFHNAGSQRVLEKAGFVREGIARGLLVIRGERVDHVRFGLLRTDQVDGCP